MTTHPHAPAEAHLQAADPVLAALIATHGPCTLAPDPHYFYTLVDSIISQQISIKAAASILRRFIALLPGEAVTPQAVLALSLDEMRAAGLSGAKTRYMHDLAAKVADGTVDLDHIDQKDDEGIISELVQVKGIGRWTAEMFLMFGLVRPDVLPVDDLGLRAGVQRLYSLPALPGKRDLQALAAPWHPYATVATWYVWRSLGGPNPRLDAANG